MDTLETFLATYGLLAIFGLMLVKSMGVPIPIPADVVMIAASARVAEGKLILWQAFVVILLALVTGGIVQFLFARGPGRSLLYRAGRYLGLTAARLDAAGVAVKKGGPLGIGFAILTPGIRAATIAACGLAGLPLRTFVPVLIIGSGLFLSLHFFLGSLIAPVIEALSGIASGPLVAVVVAVVLAAGLGVWVVIRRRQRPSASTAEVVAEAFEAWHEATCPVCLALGAASRLSAVPADGARMTA